MIMEVQLPPVGAPQAQAEQTRVSFVLVNH
jgi:hypothetical protein